MADSGFFALVRPPSTESAVGTPAPGFAAPADPIAVQRLVEWEAGAKHAYSVRTWRALHTDIRVFDAFCAATGVRVLPTSPESVREFLLACYAGNDRATGHAPRAPATLRRYISSISRIHRSLEYPDPCRTETVRLTMKSISNRALVRQRQARPFGFDELNRYLAVTVRVLRDVRDRALVSLAYDTLARADELARAQVSDLRDERGVTSLLIRKSKSDQAGQGAHAFVSRQTFELIVSWLELAKITHGPLFHAVGPRDEISPDGLSTAAIRATVRRAAQKIGVAPSGFGGHSPRVGGAQDLMAAGATTEALKQAGRWKDARMPARYAEHLSVARGAMAMLAIAQGRHKQP